MSLALDLRNAATSVLRDLGKNGTISKTTTGTYDQTTGITSAGTTTAYSIRVALTAYANKDIDGTVILAKDRKAIISASNLLVTPAVGDKIIVSLVQYTIIEVMTIDAGGIALVYIAQVRSVGKA